MQAVTLSAERAKTRHICSAVTCFDSPCLLWALIHVLVPF